MQSENRCLAETVGELRRMGGAEIARQLKTLLGDPSESERRSWENSIPVLLDVLHRAGLDRLRLALEYQTPMGNRIDGVLLGEGAKVREAHGPDHRVEAVDRYRSGPI